LVWPLQVKIVVLLGLIWDCAQIPSLEVALLKPLAVSMPEFWHLAGIMPIS
jgi:hypothetical protein